MQYIFLIVFLMCQACLGQTLSLEGSWEGELKFGGASLPFIIHVQEDNNSWIAHADSPKQGVKNIPTKVRVKGDSVFFDVSGGIQIKGVWKAAEIDAVFQQSGVQIPLLLKFSNTTTPKVVRNTYPQEPKAPYSYDTLDVRIPNTMDGVELAGTITFPKGEGKFPAVVLVSGSGPQDRDEQLFGHKPFKVLADYLTKQGIIVLRYDDRGVGKSTGSFAQGTIEHFSKDAVSAFQYLHSFEKVDSNKLGIIGHSEGGLIAYLLAGQGLPHLSFIGSLAGPSVAIDELMVDQLYAIGKASGMTEPQLEQAKQINATNFKIAKSDLKTEEAYQALVKNMGLAIQGNQMQEMKSELMSMLTPAYRYFLRIEPEKYLPKIYIPVFAAFGKLDVQVPAARNAFNLKKYLSPNTKSVIKEYEGLNHLFQPAKTGLVQEYAEIEKTMDESLLKDLSQWIKSL